MGRGSVAPLVLTVLLAVPGVGCDLGGDQPFGRDEADSVVTYYLADYSIGGEALATGPKVLVAAGNVGGQNHELEVVDDQGTTVGEISAFPPAGTPRPMALELKAGTYTIQCSLKNPDGKVHRDLGMTTKLVVR